MWDASMVGYFDFGDVVLQRSGQWGQLRKAFVDGAGVG